MKSEKCVIGAAGPEASKLHHDFVGVPRRFGGKPVHHGERVEFLLVCTHMSSGRILVLLYIDAGFLISM